MSIPGVLESLASGDLRRALDLTTDEVCRGLPAREGVLAWLSRARVLLQLGAYAEAREAASFARKVALHGEWKAEACQAHLALVACDIAIGDLARAELSLERAAELAQGFPAGRESCAHLRGELLWAQRRLDELRAALGSDGGPPSLLRLRLEMEEERWEDASVTWERLPPQTEPDTMLLRLVDGIQIAQARGRKDFAATLRAEAEALANSWVDSLPGARRGPFAARLRSLGLEIQTESSVSAIPRKLLHPLPEGADIARETRVLAEVLKRMNSENRLPPLLDLILDSALGLCGGDFGYLVVLEGERAEVRVARHEHRNPPGPAELSFSRRIAEEVARKSEPRLAPDALRDPTLGAYGDVEAAGCRSLLAVPMRIQDRPIGSIYLHGTTAAGVLGAREVEIARILADQAALAIERSTLLARAVRDPLTSLFNHAYFEKHLAAEVERCQRHQRAASLLLIDMDQFKAINDTYGHDFGTRVIKEVALVFEGSLRTTDTVSRKVKEESHTLVARYGGDEFEILLPETPKATGHMIAARLIEKVRKRVFRAPGKDVSVDLSIGVAGFPEDATDAQELFLRADEALYEAKRAGRGCAVAFRKKDVQERSEDADVDELLLDPSGRRLLAALPQILAEGPELSRTLPRALEKIVAAVQAARGFLFSVTPDRPPALLAVHPAKTAVDPARFDQAALAHSLRSVKPMVLRSFPLDQKTTPGDADASVDIGSDLLLPVPIRADFTAVFALERTAGTREFRAQDLPLFEAFARRLAQALGVGRIVEEQTSRLERLQLVLDQGLKELERRHEKCGRVGDSEAIRRVADQVERMAGSPYPVLFLGETGTEKEFTARALHYASARKGRPFFTVRCAAVPAAMLAAELFGAAESATIGSAREKVGLFEAAEGGTVFLDGVEALGPDLQARLLGMLQEGELRAGGPHVDVRILAGSNRDLDALAREGGFLPELLARLQALTITLPPLHARREDIPALIEHILDRVAEESNAPRRRIAREAVRILVNAPWPGNVLELEGVLRQACAVGEETLQVRDLPAALVRAAPDLTKTLIRRTLSQYEGDLARAAKELGVTRATLLRRMKAHGIELRRK